MAFNHSSLTDPKHGIVYNPGQIESSYHNQETVLVTVYHCWTATTHKIQSINSTNRTLTLLQAPHVDIARCDAKSGHRFYIENALELLTEPGQFYYDHTTTEVSYIPLPGEDIASFVAYAPALTTLLDVNGATTTNPGGTNRTTGADSGGIAADITVRDLSLMHAAADMDGFFVGDCDGQAGMLSPLFRWKPAWFAVVSVAREHVHRTYAAGCEGGLAARERRALCVPVSVHVHRTSRRVVASFNQLLTVVHPLHVH
jgi:hypothetical protein